MSLSGAFNDWLTGNPPGTADATSAAISRAKAAGVTVQLSPPAPDVIGNITAGL